MALDRGFDENERTRYSGQNTPKARKAASSSNRRKKTTGGGGGGGGTYTIKKGDTLSAIARRNGTTVAKLAAANNIKNPDLILAGAKLNLGGGGAAKPAAIPAKKTAAPAPKPAAAAKPAAKPTGVSAGMGQLSRKGRGAYTPPAASKPVSKGGATISPKNPNQSTTPGPTATKAGLGGLLAPTGGGKAKQNWSKDMNATIGKIPSQRGRMMAARIVNRANENYNKKK